MLLFNLNRIIRSGLHRIKNISQVARGIIEYNLISHFKPLYPKRLIINLTYWCNSRCIMCNIWKMKPKNELSLAEWKKIMADPIFSKIRSLVISGGEASLHPKVIELTELFIQSMPKLHTLGLVTNGFTTELIVKRVKQIAKICRPHQIKFWVSTSLDGLGSLHSQVRRIPQAFKKTSKTLLSLKKLEQKHHFIASSGTVIMRQTVSKADKIRNWFQKHKINFNFQLVGFNSTFVRNLNTQTRVDFRDRDKRSLYKLLKDLATKPDDRFRDYYWRDMLSMYQDNQPRTTPCPFLKDEFVLDSFGDVYYCLSEKSIGNCRQGKSVSQIYFNPENQKFRQRLPQTSCLKCNSGCNVKHAIIRDFKKYLWFYLSGNPWYGIKSLASL